MADYKCSIPGCGWTSTGWESKKVADARGAQHEAEHKTSKPMPELHEFRAVTAQKRSTTKGR